MCRKSSRICRIRKSPKFVNFSCTRTFPVLQHLYVDWLLDWTHFSNIVNSTQKRYLIQPKLWILMEIDAVCIPAARCHHRSYSIHCSLQKWKCSLGDTQYSVWSMRSSNVKKLCPTRKKKEQFSFFFLRRSSKTWIFLLKQWINSMKFVYFLDKKTDFSSIFDLFFRCEPERRFYFLFVFPPTRAKRPLSELVDQTIYWVCP